MATPEGGPAYEGGGPTSTTSSISASISASSAAESLIVAAGST